MNKILLILVPATLVLSLMYMVPSSTEFILLQQHKPAYAQVISQDNNNTNTTAAYCI